MGPEDKISEGIAAHMSLTSVHIAEGADPMPKQTDAFESRSPESRCVDALEIKCQCTMPNSLKDKGSRIKAQG